jgi:hypothetical protein
METNFTKRFISLPKGEMLEVDTTPQFLERVKQHFQLSSSVEVNDDHIRMFIYGAFKNAVDKSEKESTL